MHFWNETTEQIMVIFINLTARATEAVPVKTKATETLQTWTKTWMEIWLGMQIQ